MEDRKGALLLTVKALKCKMTAMFEQMHPADVDLVLRTIKNTRYLSLYQSLESGTVMETDPDEDILFGREVNRKITQMKKLTQLAVNNIISLFDNLLEAHAHMLTAAANVSSIGKIIHAETFHMILRASIHLMVQLTIPKCYLDPIHDPDIDTSRNTMAKKIERDLLLKGNKVVLALEPENGPTHLLCTVLWVKVSKMFLNKGTQKEAAVIFSRHQRKTTQSAADREKVLGWSRPSTREEVHRNEAVKRKADL